jgi:hypothetical protein
LAPVMLISYSFSSRPSGDDTPIYPMKLHPIQISDISVSQGTFMFFFTLALMTSVNTMSLLRDTSYSNHTTSQSRCREIWPLPSSLVPSSALAGLFVPLCHCTCHSLQYFDTLLVPEHSARLSWGFTIFSEDLLII